MRVSVIIPAYNSADTIVACLESFMDFACEVILVDDGSADGTADLVRSSFPAVRVLQQPHRGVSAARNSGLDAATGEFVAFVDADDRLLPGALAEACAAVGEAKPDIAILRILSESGEHYPWQGRFRVGRVYGKDDFLKEGFMRGSVCGCLFKRDFIQRSALRFPEGISMAEDQLFFNAAVACGGCIQFLDIPFYQVNERPGSASRRHDETFFQRLSAALFRAPEMIADDALCTSVRLSIILSITSQAVCQRRTPAWILEVTGLDQVLPLPVRGLKKDRVVVRLLNASYALFYRLVRIKQFFSNHG